MFGFGRSAKRIAELESALKRLTEAAEQSLNHARLFDIQKENRTLSFYFIRRGEVYKIDTISPLGFDVAKTKKELLP